MPVSRLARWVDNFTTSHGETSLVVGEGALVGGGADGSSFAARLPFGRVYAGPPTVESFLDGCSPPRGWGILLVRKGGFAVARLAGPEIVESKVGQRHVQGRTKAGGQSQQRFARRRDNQARMAYEAAAGHAVRILTKVELVVCGGDHTAVHEVLDDPRLAAAREAVTEPWLAVPDPRRAVLERAVTDASSVRMTVTNA